MHFLWRQMSHFQLGRIYFAGNATSLRIKYSYKKLGFHSSSIMMIDKTFGGRTPKTRKTTDKPELPRKERSEEKKKLIEVGREERKLRKKENQSKQKEIQYEKEQRELERKMKQTVL